MRRFSNIGFCVLLVIALIGCSKSPGSAAGNAPTPRASNEPEELRFVVMSPAIAIMLRDLGFEDQIVGKHAWDMVLSDSVPVVGSESGIDYESMIRADPTHIFYQRSVAGVPERLNEMSIERGWSVITMPLDTIDDIALGADDLYLKFVGVRKKEMGEVDPTIRFEQTTLPSEALARAWADLGPLALNSGRVLVLAGVEPPGAMGPGSFHHQLLEKLGATPAIMEGGMWQELDHEDIVRLNPDSIILFSPRTTGREDLFGFEQNDQDKIDEAFGQLGQLDIAAVRNGKLAIVDDPLGLIPSTSFGGVADRVAEILIGWSKEP